MNTTVLVGILILVLVIAFLALRRTAVPPESAATATRETSGAATAATAIRQYVENNYGVPGYQTSWYPQIRGITVRNRTVVVTTDLSGRGPAATSICGAVSGFVFANGNEHYGLENVEVVGQSDKTLLVRRGIAGKCS